MARTGCRPSARRSPTGSASADSKGSRWTRSPWSIPRPKSHCPHAPHACRRVDLAIERAAAAFPSWRAVSPDDRARLLRRFAGLVDDHLEELAWLEVRNSGHTIGNARWEAGNVPRRAALLRRSARAVARSADSRRRRVDITFKEPLGS